LPASVRVVLADDTDDIRLLTRLALEREPDFVVVGEARDGQEAVDVVRREQPDLLLLDLAMPVMSGMQALPVVRQVSPTTAVVVMSAFEAQALEAETRELGAVGYVQKSESLLGLAAQLRTVLGADQPEASFRPAVPPTQHEFVGMAAHELRNPITTIAGMSELLLDSTATLGEDDRERMLRSIRDQARLMNRLVDDLLTFTRLASGALGLELETVPVAEAARLAVESTSQTTPLTDARVVVDPGLQVRADRDRLLQILVIYLTNAAKHGEPPVRVEAVAVDDPDGPRVEISVVDQGEGVGPELASSLFSPWATGGRGNGLGLAIGRGLARAMQGDAHYERRADETWFIVRLPAA
jgi:signal transduction histidine kinase